MAAGESETEWQQELESETEWQQELESETEWQQERARQNGSRS